MLKKNGMSNNSFKREEASRNTSKGHNLKAMIEYCKSRGIAIEDLSPEEVEMFAAK